MVTRRGHDNADCSDWKDLEFFGQINRIRHNTDLCPALGDRSYDLPARPIL
jgi:hypothetical protein